ncbi:hypothetical protein [Haladaptatus sp. ZSTT2]|uniref:hypothetical protein n=1 Tax=Haladaptatus sp. ZSTT2 TaxID=3120515 RepID=UPI00300E7231
MTERTDDEAARMELTQDSWHEGDEGYYVDCPACGARPPSQPSSSTNRAAPGCQQTTT